MNTRIAHAALAAAVCLTASTGCDFLRGYAGGESAVMHRFDASSPVGFYRLLFEDFGGLSTDTMQRAAVPWKVMGAALLAMHHDGEPSEAALLELYASRYGLATPTRIANWPGAQRHTLDRPMGLVTGKVARGIPNIEVEVSNTGCSTCHASTMWDADGHPTPDVAWIGAPNTSVNLNRYSTEAYAALVWSTKNEERLFEVMKKTWPDVSQVEIDTLRQFVLPQLRDVIAEIRAADLDNFTPYHNGGTGLTNGVATAQYYLGAIKRDRYHADQVAFTAIPSLGGLKYKRSILIDGIYAPPGWEHSGPADAPMSEPHRDAVAGLTAVVTFSTLGVTPELAVGNKGRARDIVDYLFDTYEPPPFPGAIDAALADRGAEIFDDRCSGCHGTYAPGPDGWGITSYPNVVIPGAVIETDPRRWDIVSEDLIERFKGNALSQIQESVRTGGYVPPALDGIWARAPYLHNGSVPTMWHLLTPDARPAKFQRGGHKLDFTMLGIAGELDAEGTWRYPADYTPWTTPELTDTSEPGRTNVGHASQVAGLSEDEKTALIEHLKRL